MSPHPDAYQAAARASDERLVKALREVADELLKAFDPHPADGPISDAFVVLAAKLEAGFALADELEAGTEQESER